MPDPTLNADDTLPTLLRTDTIALRLPSAPCPASPHTAVSDSHVLLSDQLPPTLTPTQYTVDPNDAPCTVTLPAPVPARFARLTALITPADVETP